MSFKEKIKNAIDKTLTFVDENRAVIGYSLAAGAFVYIVGRLNTQEEITLKLADIVDRDWDFNKRAHADAFRILTQHAQAGNWAEKHPWYIEDGDVNKAKRLELPDEVAYKKTLD